MAASTVPLHTRPGYVTLDAFYDLHDLPKCTELADGEVVLMASPDFQHSYLTRAIFRALDAHVTAHRLGEVFYDNTGYELPVPGRPDTLRIPDTSFVRAGRISRAWRKGRALALAPDLAVEVRSSSDKPGVLRRKLVDYLEAGVALVWVIDPDARTAAIYGSGGSPDAPTRVLGDVGALDGGDVLPGFTLPLARLFAELDGFVDA